MLGSMQTLAASAKKMGPVPGLDHSMGSIPVSLQTLPRLLPSPTDLWRDDLKSKHSSRRLIHRFGKYLDSGCFSTVYETMLNGKPFVTKVFADFDEFRKESSWLEYVDSNVKKSTKHGPVLFLSAVAYGITISTTIPYFYAVLPRALGTLKSLRSNFQGETRRLEALRVAYDIGNGILYNKEKDKTQMDANPGNFFRISEEHWALGDGSKLGKFSLADFSGEIAFFVKSVVRIAIYDKKNDAEERDAAKALLEAPFAADSNDEENIAATQVAGALCLAEEEARVLVQLYNGKITLDSALEKIKKFLKEIGDKREESPPMITSVAWWRSAQRRFNEQEGDIDLSEIIPDPLEETHKEQQQPPTPQLQPARNENLTTPNNGPSSPFNLLRRQPPPFATPKASSAPRFSLRSPQGVEELKRRLTASKLRQEQKSQNSHDNTDAEKQSQSLVARGPEAPLKESAGTDNTASGSKSIENNAGGELAQLELKLHEEESVKEDEQEQEVEKDGVSVAEPPQNLDAQPPLEREPDPVPQNEGRKGAQSVANNDSNEEGGYQVQNMSMEAPNDEEAPEPAEEEEKEEEEERQEGIDSVQKPYAEIKQEPEENFDGHAQFDFEDEADGSIADNKENVFVEEHGKAANALDLNDVSLDDQDEVEEEEEEEELAEEEDGSFRWPLSPQDVVRVESWNRLYLQFNQQKQADLSLFFEALVSVTEHVAMFVGPGSGPDHLPKVLRFESFSIPAGPFADGEKPEAWARCVNRLRDLGWCHHYGGLDELRRTKIRRLKVVKVLINGIISLVRSRPCLVAALSREVPMPGASQVLSLAPFGRARNSFTVRLTEATKSLLKSILQKGQKENR
eukprot:TRINITY_DN2382_c0_g1_i1.p1 TRINITY_DN2382_c0_g1~~TRINITY_DN2382_c0_g1_i1.p1  ORF type:complete len:854 (-),score=166.43 TRINITY_DN2382_c0_g1_i1:28-2589(-)